MMGGYTLPGRIICMGFQAHPYSFLLLASALISAAVGILALARRESPPMQLLALNMFTRTIWCVCYSLVWLGTSLAAQVYWYKAMYFGVAFAPLSFLLLALGATQQGDGLIRRAKVVSSRGRKAKK